VLPGQCKIPVTYIDDDDDDDDDDGDHIYLFLHVVLWEPVMTLLIFIIDALFDEIIIVICNSWKNNVLYAV